MRLELVEVAMRHHRRGPWVLDRVSLGVEAGEIVQVVAANGGGKTTLLRLAAGLHRPTRGRVRAHADRRWVPESTPLPPALRVRAYLAHQARLQGVAGPAVERWVGDTIDAHGLAAAADRPLGQLSKGWAQRCVLAQALGPPHGRAPALVLLDEPWTGADDASRDRLVALLADRAAAGAAVVMASHEAVDRPGLRRRYLHRGRLTGDEPGDGPAVRTVALTARSGAPPLAATLGTAEGVREVQGDGDRCRLVVTADDVGDRVLVAVLQRGWTIEHLATDRGA